MVLLDAGFGQHDSYVQGNAIVTTGSEEQVESLRWIDQKLVLPVRLEPSPAGPERQAGCRGDLGVQPLGDLEVSSELVNPLDTDLENVRVGIVCYDAAGQIIGGKAEFPALIAAGTSVPLESDVVTSGTPADCVAHPNYGY